MAAMTLSMATLTWKLEYDGETKDQPRKIKANMSHGSHAIHERAGFQQNYFSHPN